MRQKGGKFKTTEKYDGAKLTSVTTAVAITIGVARGGLQGPAPNCARAKI